MECKDLIFVAKAAYGMGINRNIVECKGTNKENIDSLVRVLIETSWNVKAYTIDLSGYDDAY